MQLVSPLVLLTSSLMVVLPTGLSRQGDSKFCRQFNNTDNDEALFLTPLILTGHLKEARALSKVSGLPADVEVPSYAGFITVQAECNNNLFFWFVPSLSDPANAPILLWLQGGPGTSSLLGFFSEHGPYSVTRDSKNATFRQNTWAQRYSVLYVDQPVGTGFSFTDDEAGYARNVTDAAGDMLEFLEQFFTLFKDFDENEFYITGESYAGKYVPAVGAALHDNAPFMRVKINFRGIAFGNGFTDPVNIMSVGEFAHEIGIIDHLAAEYMKHTCEEARILIISGRTGAAFDILNRLYIGISVPDTFLMNATGFHYKYNVLQDKEPQGVRDYEQFVPRPDVRRAIHVGKRNFSISREAVTSRFVEDFLHSAVPQLTVLLENGYRVLVYSGQLDLAVPTSQTENFLSKLQWSGTSRWARAPQRPWRNSDGEKLYGYVKSVDNLHFAVVRNSGHMVPYDTPEAALHLITAFVDRSQPFEE